MALKRDTANISPAERYASADWFKKETDAIFRKDWIPVGRALDIPKAGDYKAVQIFGESIVLVRDKDGTIRALSNVCRHRLSQIATGTGNSPRLICPYHAWTYGLDGSLIGAPCMNRSPEFDRDELGLHNFHVEEWLGWIFVGLGEKPAPLAQRLAPLAAQLESLKIDTWVEGRRLTYDAPWNWKLMVENFTESYHHAAVHPETLNVNWPAAETYGVETNGHYSEIRHPIHPDAGTFTVYAVFPLLMFAVQSEQPLLFWPEMEIIGPGQMKLNMVLLAEPEFAADERAMDMSAMAIDMINLEDFPLLTAVQRGLTSHAASVGPLSHLEQPIAVFNVYIERMMSV
jgi:phenylpropionate dioxygenase-like ring-hydroxylating dioxygenase large terminal subunit